MLSIVTSIYNQKSMNEIFYQSLKNNTKNPFELIVIDNNSTDGSREFFENKEDVVLIKNDGNYNYPYCQNQGIKKAKYNLICFFNNDLIISPNWDEHIINIFNKNNKIKILSVATNDHLENKEIQKKIGRKWKKIKYPIQVFFGNKKIALRLMLKLMYGNFNKFSEKRFLKWKYKTIEGYSGSAIIIKNDFLNTIGLWDERIQNADFDLFNRVKKISIENENILPIQLALGVYFHHYQRLTLKAKYPPFANKDTMISLKDKWGNETNILRQDIIG